MSQPVVIITGAGGGIGSATAAELAKRGYATVLVGRSKQSLEDSAQHAPGALVVPTDITQPDQIKSLVSATLKKFGRIDAVVNNAGIAPALAVEETTPQVWADVLATNLTGPFELIRQVWPTFRKQSAGVVVNISSLAARDPFPGFAAYGAAKAALNALALSLSRERSAIGVRVHTIAPGAVETTLLRKIVSIEQFPSDNAMQPQDVAAVIAQCVVGDLRYTSGEVIWLSKPF